MPTPKHELMTTREVYEEPTISRNYHWAAAKNGRGFTVPAVAEIDGVEVPALLERFGSPLYVLSEQGLRTRYRELVKTFRAHYPNTIVAYSVKTNYLSAVCSILFQEGAWAEVVSGFELTIAEELKVPGTKTIFNGPSKRKDDLARAFRNRTLLNLDSFDELLLAEAVAREMGEPQRVGLRLNMGIGYPPWDKFGFNLESGQAFEACRRATGSGLLRVAGLHVHAGTYLPDPGVYAKVAENLLMFAGLIESQFGVTVEYLDLGGGFPSSNTLLSHVFPAEGTSPTPVQYAEAIGAVLRKGVESLKRKPMLFIEPGRVLVDETMCLLSTVLAVKRLPTGDKAAIIDAGVHLLPTAYYFKHEIAPVSASGRTAEDVTLYGPLCMQIDVVRSAVKLPPLRTGSQLVIKNVGAYNLAQSMQFIFPRPAVVLVNKGEAEVVRAAETAQDVRRLERLPTHLVPA